MRKDTGDIALWARTAGEGLDADESEANRWTGQHGC